MKSRVLFTVCISVLLFSIASANAGQFLKCRKVIDPQRSKISVGSEGLIPGAVYSATVISGTHSKVAMQAADPAGEAEWDFDSRRKNIFAGATPIGSNFIVRRTVSASVTDALGNVIESDSVQCRVK